VRLKKGEYAGPPPNIVPLFSGFKPELNGGKDNTAAKKAARPVKRGKRNKRTGGSTKSAS
jgi:hypothetical protein